MKLSKPVKLLVGGATVWLPLYMIAFFVIVFTGVFMHSAPDVDSFDVLFRVHMATTLLSVGLLVFYIVHIFQTKLLASDQRIMWLLVILFLGPLAMPIYFFKYVWPDELPDELAAS
jgi:hypothetical protein